MMRRRIVALCVVAVVAVASGIARAQPGGDDAPLVELPPLLVEGERRLPPWLYANVDGVEYLSRCTSSTTRGYIERRAAQLQMLRWLIPAEFLPRSDVPSVSVLYSQRLRAQTQEQMMKVLMELRRRRGESLMRNSRVGSVPNLMLEDHDFFAVFAYIDEERFRPAGLTVAVDYLDFLLERRTPALPAWLRAGLTGIYAQTKFDRRVTVDPLIWLSTAESNALASNPHWPRTLVFATDFFSSEVWRDEPAGSVKGRTLQAQSVLFVRWALDPAHGATEAFWRFAAAAVDRPVTDEMFEEYFGFGLSDWRDRLSDYLPQAVQEEMVLTPGRLPAAPRVRLREATPAEVARLQGEWERLSIPFVRRRYPEFTDRYVEQARETLAKAWRGGDRSPQLDAVMGLCELEAGDATSARSHLERAAEGGVVRPRVYWELAGLRAADNAARRDGAESLWSDAEVHAVLEPLNRAFEQRPAQAEAYRLLARTWARAADEPGSGDWRRLDEGLTLFPKDVRLAYDTAALLARHGNNEQTVAVLGRFFPQVRDEATRRQYAELFQQVTRPTAP